MNTHNIIFVFFTIFLIIVRCIADPFPHLLIIVALLNLLSLAVVIISIIEQIRKKVIIKSNESPAPKAIVARERKRLIKATYTISIALFLILSGVYLTFGLSELGNDIITILSLGLSLIDSCISDIVVKQMKL